MAYSSIIAEAANGVHRITLNRPDRLNSFNDAMHAELREALSAVAADETARVLVLTGAGRGFCAGQDLSDRAVAPGDAPPISAHRSSATIGRWCWRCAICRCRSSPRSTALRPAPARTLRWPATWSSPRSPRASSRPFCKIGLIPDSGGTYWLPRLVGDARAMGLALLGDKLPAKQAAEWGLIWRCVPDAELAAAVDQLAQHFATAPTLGLVMTQAGAARERAQRSGDPARPGARYPARPRTQRRLSRRRRRIHGQARAEFPGQVAQLSSPSKRRRCAAGANAPERIYPHVRKSR